MATAATCPAAHVDTGPVRRQIRALDLFSGIGGWSLAMHRRGIVTVAACESDEWK